jgi:NHLM bacteriocin system ABC transporter ATP-binding protein
MSSTEAAATVGSVPTAGDLAVLFAPGETLVTGGDRPFLLSGDDVWYVISGRVDVFTVRVRDGVAVGPRMHLFRASTGQALFGLGLPDVAPRWGLLAVAFQHTTLRKLPRAAVVDDLAAPGLSLVHEWIALLYGGIAPETLSAASCDLVVRQEIEVAAGGILHAGGELFWVRHVEGASRLMGREGLELADDEFVPVAGPAWLETTMPSRVVVVETRDLRSTTALWTGLERLHELILRHAGQAARANEQVFLDRIQDRRAFQQAILGDACERLVTSGTGAKTAAPSRDDAALARLDDPLLAACVLVGRALSFTIRSYPRTQGVQAPRNPLSAILRASRVRSRQVALRGEWWRDDNGPLLAYVTAGKQPVALLRGARGSSYVLHDPAARTVITVDAAVAETLEPFAHAFYRPFPERRLRLQDVLRFALQGSGRDVVILFSVAACGALLGLVPALATGILFNAVIPGAQRSSLLQMTLVMLAAAVASALFSVAQGIALLRIEGRAAAVLQSAVWDRLLALPLGFFRPYTSGDLATRAMAIEGMRQVLSGATASALMGMVFAAGNFALMYWYSPRMAVWATLMIAAIVLITLAGGYLQLRPQREAIKLEAKSAGLVLQLLTGIAKLRVSATEVPAFALWARRFGEQRWLQYKGRRIGNWVTAINAAMPVLSYLVIFSLAQPLVRDGALQTGDFLAFLTAFSMGTTLMLSASLAFLASLATVPLYEQAKPILETLPEVDVGKSDPGVLIGNIEVQHALFRYSQDGPLVLRDVSFQIKPGEFVAFVGQSGSGKSTLLRLLLGFETLEGGAIYYDGQEIGGLDVQAVRRQMGVVLQSGRLMSGDIFMNIVGSSGATIKDAWSAARMAGLGEDIEAMPMGMHTMVSEGGSTLSGGQRQRLLIARAIVSHPRILLFDEATSALDNRTQAIVSASLESLQATRIVVAHRLSTIRNADRIFVLDRGRLVQSGRYTELMAQNGLFVELAKRQIV